VLCFTVFCSLFPVESECYYDYCGILVEFKFMVVKRPVLFLVLFWFNHLTHNAQRALDHSNLLQLRHTHQIHRSG
jgi:hypothetical protein